MPPMPMQDAGMPPMDGGPDMEEPQVEDGPDMKGDEGNGEGHSNVREYAGELSQALNDYNDENPSDDEKLNKYAINMIAAQVADHLTDKDKRQVIKKLNGNADDEEEGQQEEMPDEQGGKMPQMEGRIVKEITNELSEPYKGGKRYERKITNKRIKRSPFVSNR